MTSKTFTLKDLAEAGYIMGLATIGEVANHVECHYDAYWLISELKERSLELNILIDGHEDDSIFKYLTEDDKRRMDDELEQAMNEGPQSREEPPDEEAKVEEAEESDEHGDAQP